MYVNYLWQVDVFLMVLYFPPPIRGQYQDIAEILSGTELDRSMSKVDLWVAYL